MKTTTTTITIIALTALIALLTACGSAEEAFYGETMAQAAPAAPAAMHDMTMSRAAMVMQESAPAAPAAPAPASAGRAAPASMPVPVPQPAAAAARPMSADDAVEEQSGGDFAAPPGEFNEQQAALIAQNRIIVRTVNLSLEVEDVADSIDTISQNVQRDGGWVVSSDRSSKHYGSIAVRVPAQRLDDALAWMRQLGVDVLAESSTSTDVTDEYYDLRSRVRSMQATEEALINLLDRAENVEHALEVQRELGRLQVEIEAHLGRIKLLEETAAFSLVHIALSLSPQEMRVDAGEDRTFSVGEAARFRASFYPPEGIDDFDFTWDFGDGSRPTTGAGSAPKPDGGRITATINHRYDSDLESPFIVEVSITGRGEAGIVEGSDTFIATVTELPAIIVFAGDSLFVEAGEELEFSGSFTRPEGLTNYQYSWEFSDGSEAAAGAPEDGATTVTATHVYENHRPQPYTVTLKVSADSEAGPVEGVSSFDVFVYEAQGFVVSGWSAEDNLRSAVRALSGFAQAVGTAAIWALTFIPVWIALAVVVFLFIRFRRRISIRTRRNDPPPPAARPQANPNPAAAAQNDAADTAN